MKFVIAALVFILALSITPKSVASAPADVACTADQQENCVDNQTEHKKSGHASSKEEHKEKLNKEMNSLFPEKQKNASLSASPAAVKLVAPQFLGKVSGTSAKLEWTDVNGASNYHVQVATDPNFKWLVANDAWVKGTSFEATQLEAGQTYYWRVAAVRSQNESMFTKSLFTSSAFTTQK